MIKYPMDLFLVISKFLLSKPDSSAQCESPQLLSAFKLVIISVSFEEVLLVHCHH